MTNPRGFTFFEVMVAVAILATSVVLILKALLTTVDWQNHLVDRLYAMNILQDRMAVLERQLRDRKEIAPGDLEGVRTELVHHHPLVFRYAASVQDVGDLDTPVKAVVAVAWPERGRTFQVSQEIYFDRKVTEPGPSLGSSPPGPDASQPGKDVRERFFPTGSGGP